MLEILPPILSLSDLLAEARLECDRLERENEQLHHQVDVQERELIALRMQKRFLLDLGEHWLRSADLVLVPEERNSYTAGAVDTMRRCAVALKARVEG